MKERDEHTDDKLFAFQWKREEEKKEKQTSAYFTQPMHTTHIGGEWHTLCLRHHAAVSTKYCGCVREYCWEKHEATLHHCSRNSMDENQSQDLHQDIGVI